MQNILLIDLGSTYTKVTAVDIAGEYVVGTAKAFTTVASDINIGLQQAIENLHLKTGLLEYSNMYACSSAAGGLKMIAVGLVPELTAQAAQRAALSAGAKVLKTYSYELSLREIEEIHLIKPDIILLSGGTDGGNKKVLLQNAMMLSGIPGDFSVVVAGNKSAVDEAALILTSSGKSVTICENVMPEFNVLNIEPARKAIREIFLQRIIRAKGLTGIQELIEGILMPTPSAVLKAAVLLATGKGREPGIGDLMVIDVGGATTDVYSIADGKPTKSGVIEKGLPEPFEKRTVEGDLGVRYSSKALIDSAGYEKTVEKSGLTEEQFKVCLELINDQPEILSAEYKEIESLDYGLAAVAVKLATDRHVGSIESSYGPFGLIYTQQGKDLTKVKTMIGTGGPIINCVHPKKLLQETFFDNAQQTILKPQSPEIFLDEKYIMAAMGLLSEYYPEIALRILKKELKLL